MVLIEIVSFMRPYIGNKSKKEKNPKVRIRQHLLKSLPLPRIQARAPTAIILSFTAFRHEIISILQKISHKSRAFIINANFLPGFLQKADIFQILNEAHSSGHF